MTPNRRGSSLFPSFLLFFLLFTDGSNFELKNFKLKQGSLGLRLGVSKPMTNALINYVEVFNTRKKKQLINI